MGNYIKGIQGGTNQDIGHNPGLKLVTQWRLFKSAWTLFIFCEFSQLWQLRTEPMEL